ncbi:sensor histidine kinase [Streptomyces sp. NPDC002680]|uniref:sensor histidine kinase n=1 Tax=Streptomyces sp. NPDC002680 TaxID=3364659 RepID=UPI0036973609
MRAETAMASHHPPVAGASRAPGAVPSPPPGLEAAWAHPTLALLLRTQRRLRRVDRQRPWALDAAVPTVIAAMALLDVRIGEDRGPFEAARPDLPFVVLLGVIAVTVLPLWWRRRAPVAVFTVVTAGALVPWTINLWLLAGACLLTALYNLTLHGPVRLLGWAAVVVLIEIGVAVWFLLPSREPTPGLLILASQEIAAIGLALALRTQRANLAALEDRAARMEVEREQRERLTAAAERYRVAREMHDIVGHNLAVVVGLADGAAALAASRGEHSAEALGIIGDTSREAMSELRRVLGVLGDEPEDAPLSPQPGLVDLDTLLARVRAAGLSVSYCTEGDLTALGGGIQLTVYRIVQEALTNTLKHAGPGSAAHASVSTGKDGVRVQVTDTGPHPCDRRTDPLTNTSSGHGLVGMRQRSAMYGGTVSAGPRTGRPGWIVDVTLEPTGAEGPRSAVPRSAPGDHAP